MPDAAAQFRRCASVLANSSRLLLAESRSPNALSDLRLRNTTPHPYPKNFFKFPAAVPRTLRLSDGDQPSSTPGNPSAWRDQRQKLKRCHSTSQCALSFAVLDI